MKYLKYIRNENYFDIIDSEDKAYFLGFLYADGNNFIGKYDYKITISLMEKDKEILDTLNRKIYPDKELLYRKSQKIFNKKTNKWITSKPQYKLQINSKYMCNVLLEHGVMPNKSFKIRFPNFIDEKLYNHFIRGYFDGDGSIGSYLGKHIKTEKFRISIISNHLFLNDLQQIFNNELNININILNRQCGISELRCCGNVKVKKIMDWIYKDSTIYLERKYLKYLKLCEIENNKISINVYFTYKKLTFNQSTWAKILEIQPIMFSYWLKRGLSFEDIIIKYNFNYIKNIDNYKKDI